MDTLCDGYLTHVQFKCNVHMDTLWMNAFKKQETGHYRCTKHSYTQYILNHRKKTE